MHITTPQFMICLTNSYAFVVEYRSISALLLRVLDRNNYSHTSTLYMYISHLSICRSDTGRILGG